MSIRMPIKKLLNVAFDLDGTLIDLMTAFERILWERYQCKIPHHRNYKIVTEPDLSWDKIEKVFCEAFSCIEEIQLKPGAYEILKELYSRSDHDPIRIITARPYWIAANDTYDLVDKICQDIPYEIVIVATKGITMGTGPDAEKHIYLNRYKYYVDDRRKTCIDLSTNHNKICFMPTTSYNTLPIGQRFDGIIPIANIGELKHHIEDSFYTEVRC